MNEQEQELVDLIDRPQALRARVETLGISPGPGTTGVRCDVGDIPNLNALAIGLGLENIQYEPATFAGLIYHLDMPDVTVVLGFNGIITVIDAEDEATGREAIQTVIERLQMLFEGGDEHEFDQDAVTEDDFEYENVEAGEPNPEGPFAVES